MLDKIKKYIPINFEIASNPVNWIIVILMIAVAGVGLAAIIKYSGADYEPIQQGNE